MNDLTYMRDELNDEHGILRLQNKILEIAYDFDRFCRENNIKYYLMGGTALGAARHGGFIPWDDDFDDFMEYKEYQRFLDIAPKKIGGEKYHIQRENTPELPYYFSKVYMNGTACISEHITNKNIHQGIFIDIMCLNYISNNALMRKLQFLAAGLLKARAVSIAGYKTESIKKKIQICIVNIFVRGLIKKWLLSFVRKNNRTGSSYLGHFFGRAKFANAVYTADFLGSGREMAFEKLTFPVPEKIEQYLETRFGDSYMDMPDEKTKAMYQSHAFIWDVDKDYTEYLKSL